MHRFRWLRPVFALSVIVGMLAQGTGVLAGTTGQITGTVTVGTTGKPIAGATITAVSPSQNAHTSTDGQGRFTLLSLQPDTYTISVDAKGYQGQTLSGVTVQADQTQTLALTAQPALQTIGRTQSRAATDVIKPGTTADVYSISSAQAAAAAPLGGGGALNQAYSAIASVPGVFVPVGQQGWAQSVYVRGGNYTQLGYDYDGVPVQRAYDAYPSSTLSALGQQEVQVYTGSQPASAQSNGLAGFVNQVIKTGTYPGTKSFEGSIGSPAYYHKAQAEFGGASPSRNLSYYFGAAGYNQSPRFVDQFDGGGVSQLYSTNPYAAIAHNCGTYGATAGCYSNSFGSAPNGYVWTPISYGQDENLFDREVVGNIHVGIPHAKDGLRDDVQLLGSISYLGLTFNDAYNRYGGAAVNFFQTGTLSLNGVAYPTCTDALINANTACAVNLYGIGKSFTYPTRSIYVGPTNGALTSANLSQVSQYFFPNQPSGQPINAPVEPNNVGNEKINDGIFKFQYTHAMGTNAYARLYAYSLYSDWLNNDPNGGTNPLAFVPSNYILPTHTRGLGLTMSDQLGNHLLTMTGGYSYAGLSRWNNSFPSTSNPVAVLVDSTNPTAGCYNATLSLVSCLSSRASRYVIPGTNKPASLGLQPGTYTTTSGGVTTVHNANGTITVNNASSFTCGSGPCEFLAVGSGLNGSFNNVTPRFSNLTLGDSWNVTPKLTLDAAVRYDSFRYDIPSATSPGGPNPDNASTVGRALFTNNYNMFHCYSPSTGVTSASSAGVCPAGTSHVAFDNNNLTQMWFGGYQPRVGATYKLDNLNVLRVGYGRYLQPVSTAYTFYNRAGADIANYDVPKFYPYGFTTAQHTIPPEESFNLDMSWEHQSKGTDLSWKISPFYRKTHHEDINVILDPVTNFVSGIPALSSDVTGLELLLRKGDFNRNGFAGQLSYTYTHVTSHYEILPGGSTALDNVNLAIKNYNAYTSYCATHASDTRCGSTTSGAKATPCYTSTGAEDAACGAGSFANPYWNAPVQGLFDPNASYYAYNQTFGTGFSSNASSYNIPHVAALILNYKHNKWSFTPSAQFTAGGRYGSPTMGIGIDPASGCGILSGSTANDPRYPYGAAGGAPYEASSCTGYITGPNPFTKQFDRPGSFVEPSQLTTNLQVSYQASKAVTLNVLAVNVLGTCFGGTQEPWTNAGSKIGCWYGAGSGFQAGNFYNPGDAFTPQAYPYLPVTGGIAGQQAYGTSVNPFQLYFTVQLKI